MKPHELALRVLICLEVKRGSARLLECRRPLNLGDPEEEERGQEAVGGVPAPGTGRPWLSPSPELPCATPASPQPRAGLTPFPPSCPLLPIPLLPSPPPLLLGVEIAFQLPFAFPINPDSAIKPAGGAGREAAAGTGPLGAVASAPLPFRPRLLPAPPCAAGRPGRGAGTPGARAPSSPSRPPDGRGAGRAGRAGPRR